VSWMAPGELDLVVAALRSGRRSDEALARWIEERFAVPVVETVVDRPHDRDRLVVWVRTEEEAGVFRNATGNWDARKQEAIREHLGRPDLFVIAVAADPALRRRATAAVGDDRLTAASATVLGDPSTVDRVFAALGRVHVFLHTDVQVEALRGTAAHTRLADALWLLVNAHDEFGVVPRESFDLVLDSRQNLDENFEGSTYYYLL
jgi:hypothetical protein